MVNCVFITDGLSEFQINSMDIPYPARVIEKFQTVFTIKSNVLKPILENAFLNVEEKRIRKFPNRVR